MAEPRQIAYSYEELASLLIKEQEIHEGLWGVFFEFGIGGTNVSPAEGVDAVPAAIVPLQRIGLQKFDVKVPGLTVDAAEVNPAPTASGVTGNE
jgi:hypothetical protein